MCRALWTIVALAALASLVSEATAGEAIPKIGFLGFDSTLQAPRAEAFREGLRALGYLEGRNLTIDYRWAENKFDRLPQLAAELVAGKVSVIVTVSRPGIDAARKATTSIPIVMLTDNPIDQGFVASFARPGGNITGVAFQGPDLTIKRLSYLRDVVPGLQRVAILSNIEAEVVESVARPLGLQTRVFEAREETDLPAAIKAAKSWGAQGMMVPLFTPSRKVLIAELAANRMPAVCGLREHVVDGCLMTYTPDLNAMFRQMASFVDRILRGAKAGDLPIEQPREFDFIINKKTADALGLRIPKSVEIQMSEPFL